MTKLHTTYSILALFSLFTFLGCNKTTEELLSANKVDKEAIHFKLKIPGMTEPATYSMDGQPENDIKNITLLLFHENGNHSYELEKSVNVNANISRTAINLVEFNANLNLNFPQDKYCISIVANPSNGLQNIINAIKPGTSKSMVMHQLVEDKTTPWETDASNYTPIPMYCEVAPKVFSNGETLAGLSLIRMLARIDISCSILNQPMSNVMLYNYPTNGTVVPNWDSQTGLLKPQSDAPQLPANFKQEIGKGFFFRISQQPFTGEIYTFESPSNPSGSPISDTTSRINSSCLVVNIPYNHELNNWYRIDFTDQNNKYIPLLRNHKYSINITGIEGPGAHTPEEAVKMVTGQKGLQYYILTYNLKDEIKSFAYNGQYYIGTDCDTIHIPASGKMQQIKYFTNYRNDIKDVNGIDPINQGQILQWAHVIRSNHNISITCDPNPDTQPREGILTLQAGTLTKQIVVVQDGKPSFDIQTTTSNCYIVTTNNTQGIGIPVSRANESPEIGIQIESGDKLSAELIWTDNSNGMSSNSNISSVGIDGDGPSANLIVKTGPAEGNAVVAIKDVAGRILWSWHIWVCKSTNLPKKISINHLMDRNLGAFSIDPQDPDKCNGLFYQWGRKDPFPGLNKNNGITNIYDKQGGPSKWEWERTIVRAHSNLQNSIENPNLFYKGLNTIYDWYTASGARTDNLNVPYQNDNLWGSSQSSNYTKSVYDPCPEGYKIPTALTMFTTQDIKNQGGNIYISRNEQGQETILPKAGYYNAPDNPGNPLINTTSGFYWTHKTLNDQGEGLGFDKNSLATKGLSRDSGCSVRCIHE